MATFGILCDECGVFLSGMANSDPDSDSDPDPDPDSDSDSDPGHMKRKTLSHTKKDTDAIPLNKPQLITSNGAIYCGMCDLTYCQRCDMKIHNEQTNAWKKHQFHLRIPLNDDKKAISIQWNMKKRFQKLQIMEEKRKSQKDQHQHQHEPKQQQQQTIEKQMQKQKMMEVAPKMMRSSQSCTQTSCHNHNEEYELDEHSVTETLYTMKVMVEQLEKLHKRQGTELQRKTQQLKTYNKIMKGRNQLENSSEQQQKSAPPEKGTVMVGKRSSSKMTPKISPVVRHTRKNEHKPKQFQADRTYDVDAKDMIDNGNNDIVAHRALGTSKAAIERDAIHTINELLVSKALVERDISELSASITLKEHSISKTKQLQQTLNDLEVQHVELLKASTAKRIERELDIFKQQQLLQQLLDGVADLKLRVNKKSEHASMYGNQCTIICS